MSLDDFIIRCVFNYKFSLLAPGVMHSIISQKRGISQLAAIFFVQHSAIIYLFDS